VAGNDISRSASARRTVAPAGGRAEAIVKFRSFPPLQIMADLTF
jgi:hypothetical protein